MLIRYTRYYGRVATAACVTLAACHASPHALGGVTVGALTVSGVYLVAPAGDAPAAMYFTVQNDGAAADTLTGVRVAGVTTAALHAEVMSRTPHTMPSMNMATMVATPSVPIPSHSMLHLAPGGRHVMLMGIQRHFARGDSTTADLIFARIGDVHIPVHVVDYSQLDTLVEASDSNTAR